jgi:hypothetical protein
MQLKTENYFIYNLEAFIDFNYTYGSMIWAFFKTDVLKKI